MPYSENHGSDQHAHQGENGDRDRVVVPVIQEDAQILTRQREGDSVRIRRTDTTREQTLSVPLTREHVDVQRVSIGAPVDGPMAPWQDGDTLVIPIMEQVPVVKMQWVVREEVRVTRTVRREEHQQTVRLARQDVTIVRTEAPGEQQGAGRQQYKGGTR